MSEYGSGYGGDQNLYGNAGDGGYGANGGMSQGGGASGYHGQHQQQHHQRGGYHHSRHGSNAGPGQGWDRSRGPRRSGGGGGWAGRHGGSEGHGGGGGHRNRERDVMDAQEYNRRRLRDTLFRLGDAREGSAESFHPQSELYHLKKYVEQEAKQSTKSYETVLNAFKVMATEQPHKTALTASLLAFLLLSAPEKASAPVEDSSGWDTPAAGETNVEDVGLRLVADLVNAFRQSIDARLWRNARLFLNLFASMVPLGIVQGASLRRVLASLASVLDEPGVSAARGDRAASCIIEVLCRSGADLCKDSAQNEDSVALQELDDLVQRIEKYANEYRSVEAKLVQPFAILDQDASSTSDDEDWFHEESFEGAVKALKALQARGYSRPAFLPTPLDLLPPSLTSSLQLPRQDAVALPELLIPPDDESTASGLVPPGHNGTPARSRSRRPAKGASVSTDGEAQYRAGAGVDRVYRYPNWFKGTVPAPETPESVVIRSLLREVIDLYQVNRKEAARILLDMPRWHRKGTFVGRSVTADDGIFGDPAEAWQVSTVDGEQALVGGWSIDEVVVECILSASLVLPRSPQKPVYYTSLLREVVTLAPQSIAPAMGKSVRRVYGLLGTGRSSAEAIGRFADWFSVHLSNFNFGWNWKEWIPDVGLGDSHPKIAFAKRIIELEIRLAYHERIKQTLPAEIQERLLPSEEASPSFTYAADTHPFNARAMGLVQSMRARAVAEVILAELQSFRQEISPDRGSSFVPSDDDAMGLRMKDESEVELVICDMVIQIILHLGSRSFSHFLNVVERYHTLLRQLSSSPAMRLAILASTTRFWAKSAQWRLIVIDKWLQYRIVEPTDIIEFAFSPPTGYPEAVAGAVDSAARRDWSSFFWWELVRLTVHKVLGRVDQTRKRLDKLQREQDEREEREEIARESAAAEGQPQDETPKLPLFPSGATTSTLPRRPDLPPAEAKAEVPSTDKKQTVDELKRSLELIVKEERKVLIHTMNGFVKRLANVPESIWLRQGQDSNDEQSWQSWWIKEWYVEYCRLFNKELMAHHETILANALADVDQAIPLRDTFERACQMATE